MWWREREKGDGDVMDMSRLSPCAVAVYWRPRKEDYGLHLAALGAGANKQPGRTLSKQMWDSTIYSHVKGPEERERM